MTKREWLCLILFSIGALLITHDHFRLTKQLRLCQESRQATVGAENIQQCASVLRTLRDYAKEYDTDAAAAIGYIVAGIDIGCVDEMAVVLHEVTVKNMYHYLRQSYDEQYEKM